MKKDKIKKLKVSFEVEEKPMPSFILTEMKDAYKVYTSLNGEEPRSCYLDMQHYLAFKSLFNDLNFVATDASVDELPDKIKRPTFLKSQVTIGNVVGGVFTDKELE